MKANQDQQQLVEELKKQFPGNALIEALELTTGDRHHSYGPPTKNFQVTAALMGEYLEAKKDPFPITTVDVSVLMMLLKIARLAESPLKRDHMVDIAGYASCGAQCQEQEIEDDRFAKNLSLMCAESEASLPPLPAAEDERDAHLDECLVDVTPDALGEEPAVYRSIGKLVLIPGKMALFESPEPYKGSGLPVAIWDSAVKAIIEIPLGLRNGVHLKLEGPAGLIDGVIHGPTVEMIGARVHLHAQEVVETYLVKNHD